MLCLLEFTTSIKWNLPSHCFRWRQQLLLPNLEKPLETTLQPFPTVTECIRILEDENNTAKKREGRQMSAGKSKRSLADIIFTCTTNSSYLLLQCSIVVFAFLSVIK
ncbi:hypothetical protein ACQJBY_064723 [Aegilops geniculata]